MISKKDMAFFERARIESKKAEFPQKIGCIVTYKRKIIAKGFNTKKTHPLQKKYDKERTDLEEGSRNLHSMHAEIHALSKIKDQDIDWSCVELYIYRSMTQQPFGMAKPCPSCQAMISELGIKKIHYTTNENSYITETWE